MLSAARRNPLLLCDDTWDPIFFQPRAPEEDGKLFWQTNPASSEDETQISKYLGSCDEPERPRCEIQELERFCSGMRLENLVSGDEGQQRNIWVDDRVNARDHGPGEAVLFDNPLTATGFCRIHGDLGLGKSPTSTGGGRASPTHDHPTAEASAGSTAKKRLVYIRDLNPCNVFALMRTASAYQGAALRAGIYKHLRGDVSIGVEMTRSFKMFLLNFHLPVFVLRDYQPEQRRSQASGADGPRRQRILDLRFLHKYDHSQSPGYKIAQKSHVSCVIVGSSDWRWTSYSFVDAVVESEEGEGLVPWDPDDKEELNEDPLTKMDASQPLWKPRDYFLKALEAMIMLIREKWNLMVDYVRGGIEEYMSGDEESDLSPPKGTLRSQKDQMAESYKLVTKASGLLEDLTDTLSDSVEAWKRFRRDKIGFFADLIQAPEQSSISLGAIETEFEKLESYWSQLNHLNKRCLGVAKKLNLALLLASNEAAKQSAIISEISFTILYPIALTAAIFSMQTGAIPLPPTPTAFAMSTCFTIALLFAIRKARDWYCQLKRLTPHVKKWKDPEEQIELDAFSGAV